MTEAKGYIMGAFSYVLWGLLPIYWHLLNAVDSFHILLLRIVFSFIFMIIVLVFLGKWMEFVQLLRSLKENRSLFFTLLSASLLITFNWYLYIWAVNHHHLLDASLGYYINPLFNVLIGALIFKEGRSLSLWIAVALIGTAIGYLIVQFGEVPWIALSLAATFCGYGILKRRVKMDASFSLTVETLFVFPIALVSLLWNGQAIVEESDGNVTTTLLMIGSGVVTAAPLLLFAGAAKRIRFIWVGILQYIAPTISLFIGVFLFQESFTMQYKVVFALIWFAIFIYTTSSLVAYRRTLHLQQSPQ